MVNMVIRTPDRDEEGMRYSVIYEFNESKAIGIYEKYLTEIITTKIPSNGTVILHGYTDIIGQEANNQELSFARANIVKEVIEKSLSKTGRKYVTLCLDLRKISLPLLSGINIRKNGFITVP